MTSATGALAEASGTVVGHACAAVGQHATSMWTEHSSDVTMKLARGVGKVRHKLSERQKRAASGAYRRGDGDDPPTVTEDGSDEAEDWLSRECEQAGWGDVGTWCENGKVLEHYILPKYKDVIAD